MKLLIVKPSSLGDVIHALRVISVLRKNDRKLTIHWVIRSGLEGIVKASGLVDRHFVFHRGGGLRKYLGLGKRLRAENYDCVLDMQGLLRSAVLGFMTGCPKRYGRADGREGSTFFYQGIGPTDRKETIHAIDRLLPLLEPLGKRPAGDRLSLSFPHSASIPANRAIKDGTSPKVILFPESRRKEKVWPFFDQLSSSIQQAKLGAVMVCGTSRGKGYDGAIDLRGKLGLEQVAHLVKSADLVVSNDSAPLHLASALARPVLGLFGPTDPLLYGPYPVSEANSSILRSPSGKIEEIDLDAAFSQVRKMLPVHPR